MRRFWPRRSLVAVKRPSRAPSPLQELEKTSAGLRDALTAARGQLQDALLHQQPHAAHKQPGSALPPAPSASGAAGAPRAQELLDLANAECAALREETAELESEARELRRALDEAESARHAHTASHRQLSKALADAQAGIKQLLAEGDAAAAAAQRTSARVAELEEAQAALLARLADAERERAEFGDMTLHANVSARRGGRGAQSGRALTPPPPPLSQREASVLEERAHSALQRASELSSELEATGASLSDARQEVRALQRELSATKHDASQMVKVCCNARGSVQSSRAHPHPAPAQVIAAFEQQQAALGAREAELRKAEDAAARQVQAVLVERDAAVAKEAQARRCAASPPPTDTPRPAPYAARPRPPRTERWPASSSGAAQRLTGRRAARPTLSHSSALASRHSFATATPRSRACQQSSSPRPPCATARSATAARLRRTCSASPRLPTPSGAACTRPWKTRRRASRRRAARSMRRRARRGKRPCRRASRRAQLRSTRVGRLTGSPRLEQRWSGCRRRW